ncbi:hypothetical protein TURU_019037 [Turdus rufiventris]|nr:hypothetical protein TURU_019037 [Turdus rufiventris]
MKFKKDQCKVLHLGQGKRRCHQILGGVWIDNNPVKRDLAILAGENLDIIWQYAHVSQEINLTLACIKRRTGSLDAPHNPYIPLPERRERPSSSPVPSEKPAPSKPKQQQYLCVILFLGQTIHANADGTPPRRGIILSQVTGQGKCFGNATLAKRMGNICLEFVKLNGGKFKWVIPAASGMWVCQRSGVSPCVLLDKFDNSAEFCVQVLIVPRVLYRQEEEAYHLFEEPDRLHKREVITGITIAMLLGLGATGAATGILALATQQQGLSQLQMTVDEDLQRLGNPFIPWRNPFPHSQRSSSKTGKDWTFCSCSKEACVPP